MKINQYRYYQDRLHLNHLHWVSNSLYDDVRSKLELNVLTGFAGLEVNGPSLFKLAGNCHFPGSYYEREGTCTTCITILTGSKPDVY